MLPVHIIARQYSAWTQESNLAVVHPTSCVRSLNLQPTTLDLKQSQTEMYLDHNLYSYFTRGSWEKHTDSSKLVLCQPHKLQPSRNHVLNLDWFNKLHIFMFPRIFYVRERHQEIIRYCWCWRIFECQETIICIALFVCNPIPYKVYVGWLSIASEHLDRRLGQRAVDCFERFLWTIISSNFCSLLSVE